MSDAYSQRDGSWIRIGTGGIAMELELTGKGEFFLTSLVHKATGREYVQPGPVRPDEFSVTIDGAEVRGASSGFALEGVDTATLSQGELETIVKLSRGNLGVRRHYVAYPGLPVIQSWTEYENRSGAVMAVSRPSLYVVRLLGGEREKVDFSYMTGGANFTGSQMYKTVPLREGFVKRFDSQTDPEIIEVDGEKKNEWHPRLNGCGVWNEFFCTGDEFTPDRYDGTFHRMLPLKTVVISNGIREIFTYGFFGCCGLETLVLPRTLQKMYYDFYDLFLDGTSSLQNGFYKKDVTVRYRGSRAEWDRVARTSRFNDYVEMGRIRMEFLRQ